MTAEHEKISNDMKEREATPQHREDVKHRNDRKEKQAAYRAANLEKIFKPLRFEN